jgi:hypothetical protein
MAEQDISICCLPGTYSDFKETDELSVTGWKRNEVIKMINKREQELLFFFVR